MAFPAAPQDANSVNMHFLTTNGNAAGGWFSVVNDTTTTGTNVVGFAAVATHIEGDTLTTPGGLTVGTAPLVLVGGDSGGSAVPLQLSTSDSLAVAIVDTSYAVADGNALGEGVLIQGDDGADRKNVNVDATTGDIQTDITEIVPLTGATNLGKAVDTATGATDTGVAVLAVRDDALGGITPIAGDYATLLVDANGALWTHDDALDAALSGSELQVDVVAALPTGANTIGEVTIGVATTATTDLAKAEDVAHGSGDVGIQMLAVRKATPADLSGTDGDYEPLQLDNGRLWTSSDVAGDVAHDSADSGGGGPVKIGGQANSAERTAVVAGRRVDGWFDGVGRLIVQQGHAVNSGPVSVNATSNSVDKELIAAPGAGTHIYVTKIMVGNAGTSVNTINIAEETTATASNIKVKMRVAADGGGFVTQFVPPWKVPANKALVCDLSATGDMDINLDWYEAGDILV